jgi:SAM-dependent methyltransferase
MILDALRNRLAARFWGKAHAAGGIHTWMAEPSVRSYINQSVTGSENAWPLEWLAEHLEDAPLERCISLGCGEGGLERDLRAKNIVSSIVGFDLSESILGIARDTAEESGIDGIEYRVGDMNRLDLPAAAYSGAFFHHSLHHVADLEACLDCVGASLVPGGLLYLDEYVGPSRREWRRPMIARAQEIYSALPQPVKRTNRLRLPVDWRDPSEALRSSEILGAVGTRFHVTAFRPYGGNLLSVIYPYLDVTGVSRAELDRVLEDIIASERELIRDGAESFCAVVVARKTSE